nr:unnamed protein product [Digitaria exilis]
MDISRLFYTSREEAKAAETKSKEDVRLLRGKGSLPEPSMYYSPHRLEDAFALFGKSKVLCSDAGGFATMYNPDLQSFLSMPELNSPKGPRYIAISIPRTAAHARADFEIHPDVDSSMFGDKLCGNHTNSLYMMSTL